MSLLRFVPEYKAPTKEAISKFQNVIEGFNKLIVMTGAGISTESGIPDYRSEKVGQYARSNHRPIEHRDFMQHVEYRKRYWSRNFVAWPRFCESKPNLIHETIASWEKTDKFVWLITQNVDGLHTKAGSKMLSELHGCNRQVKCMNCSELYPREIVQEWIKHDNQNWLVTEVGELAPDGDIEISDEASQSFKPPHCPKCGPGSILKTDVVFFGDCVSSDVVELCYDKVFESDGMLILGSSLTVMSGYRFVLQAHSLQIPIIIVNIGPTRADDIATIKLSAKCSDIIKNIQILS